MRVKLSLLPPFTTSKYLIPLPATIKTISNLKKHLYTSLSVLSAHAESWKELKLEIEGFELLAGSEVDIIQDGDVVGVGLRAGSSKFMDKAKVAEKDMGLGKKRKVKTTPEVKSKKRKVDNGVMAKPIVEVIPPPRKERSSSISSSSSSSSSTTTSPSSSSSSSSSSESAAESDPDPSTSSSSPSLASTSHPPIPINPFPVLKPLTSNQPHIPPGKGNSQTHLRNLRRRRKRALQSQPPNPPQNSNPDPLPHESIIPQINGATSYTTQMLAVPRDMANRNKKKGFLNGMKGVRGMKTVFGQGDGEGEGDGGDVDMDVEDEETIVEDIAMTIEVPVPEVMPVEGVLVPKVPAQLEGDGEAPTIDLSDPTISDIPINVFITTQQFTRPRGGWGAQYRNLPEHRNQAGVKTPEYAATQLETETIVDIVSETSTGADMFEMVEGQYDSLETVDANTNLHEDVTIAWKELELDMITFSPQLRVQMARVTRVSNGEIKLKKLNRPIIDDEGNLQEDSEEVIISLSLADLTSGRYRVVPPPIAGKSIS